jgi:hypothetical protein
MKTRMPTQLWVYCDFWPKMAWHPCLTPRTHPILPRATFFLFPRLKRDLKGKRFADVEDVKKKKTTEAVKDINSDEFKKCLSNGNDVWTSAPTQMESTLKGIKVLLCKNKYRNFINNSLFLWVSPRIMLRFVRALLFTMVIIFLYYLITTSLSIASR